jgi:hypothetical protein
MVVFRRPLYVNAGVKMGGNPSTGLSHKAELADSGQTQVVYALPVWKIYRY